jgi:hypothetical protein
VLHPVGPLPAVVYWRRRLLVLGCAVGLLGGGGWVTTAAMGSGPEDGTAAAATTGPAPAPPVLDQLVPSLAAVELPTTAPTPTGVPEPVPPGPVEGGPCTDDMISVEVRSDPASTPVGSKPTFHLVVTNVAPVSCVRTLDKGLQEVVLLDAAGTRLWGSNDCFPEASDDVRTLAPGEVVAFPVVWGGLTSEPTCTAPRVPPAPGSYLLRDRLDTTTSADAAITLT